MVFFLTIDRDPDSARIEINGDPVPLAVSHRCAVYQLGRSIPFVHQKSNFTLEQLDPEVIGVRGLAGVVEQQAALLAGLQLEFPFGARAWNGSWDRRERTILHETNFRAPRSVEFR